MPMSNFFALITTLALIFLPAVATAIPADGGSSIFIKPWYETYSAPPEAYFIGSAIAGAIIGGIYGLCALIGWVYEKLMW